MQENKILYNSKYLQLKTTKAPNGEFDWTYAHRPNTKSAQSDAVIIVPILHKNNEKFIIFLETKRPPIYAENKAETCIELPAGLIGDVRDNESIIEAAKTELLEETGYIADRIQLTIENSSSSGGCLSETIAYTIADIKDTKQKETPSSDNGVIIAHHKINIKDVDKWILAQAKEKKSISSQTLGALYCLSAFYK